MDFTIIMDIIILMAPIHCRELAIDVMVNFSKSVPMKKQAYLHIGWSEVE